MGTGWRRAFCTTIARGSESRVSEKQQQSNPSPSPSPRSCTRLSFFSGGSNPSTPRLQSQSLSSPSLRCRTTSSESTVQTSSKNITTVSESPRLECKTTTPKTSKSPRTLLGSNPSSPRSPLKLSLFKNSFKFRVSIVFFLILEIHVNCFLHFFYVGFCVFSFFRVAVEYA